MLRKIQRRGKRIAAIVLQQSEKVFSKPASASAGSEQVVAALKTASKDLNRIVITGGTRGVGKALAEHFASLGKQVAIIGTNADAAAKVADGIEGVRGYGMDVINPDQANQVMTQIAKDLGGIDLLVNNAGVTGKVTKGEALSADEMNVALNVNVTGALNTSNAVAEIMKQQGQGRIINISTGAVSHAMAGATAYGVSKSALEGLTRQLAAELSPFNIAVTTVRLGSIKTDMTKEVFGWAKAETLPEPAKIVPAISQVAAAPLELVQGRTFAAWRMLGDAQVELRAPTGLSAIPTFRYPSYEFNGRTVERGEEAFAIYDRAENYFGCSPEVEKAVLKGVKERAPYVYPDEAHTDLTVALGDHYGLKPDQFAVGNGSWEVLDRILEMFTQTGDEVISNKPGWFGFHMLCTRRELQNVKVPMKWDKAANKLTLNLDQVAASVTSKTKLIYLISPSNPEGATIPEAEMMAFLDKIPDDMLVILDEAYSEFCAEPDNANTKSLLEKINRPIIGLRTFSKFHALASYRVGYAYGRALEMDVLRRGERVFNVPYLSQVAAKAALQDTEHHKWLLGEISIQRDVITKAMGEMGLDVIPSQAPYVLVELPCALEKLCGAFKEHGIFIGEKSFMKGKYFLYPVTPEDKTQKNLEIMATLAKG